MTAVKGQPPSDDLSLDAYLDGAMSDAERASFVRRLEREESLRREIERQRRIDASLERVCEAPVLLRWPRPSFRRDKRPAGLPFIC